VVWAFSPKRRLRRMQRGENGAAVEKTEQANSATVFSGTARGGTAEDAAGSNPVTWTKKARLF